MIPRRLLAILVYALPVLVVFFGVALGGACLAAALGDSAGGRGLAYVAVAVLLLLASDVVLLVGVLGVRALEAASLDAGEPSPGERSAGNLPPR